MLPAFETTCTSTYSPPFQYVPLTSTATQTMPLDAGKGPGVLLGIERALGPHVGLQLSAHYFEADLSGGACHYDLRMTYTSREMADIQAGLAPTAVRVDPPFFRVTLGLVFGF